MILRDYQEKAVSDAVHELSEKDRATVIMCCGSGKSIVCKKVAEKLNCNNVMVIAPTIMLLNQLYDLWKKYNKNVLIVDSETGNLDHLTRLLKNKESVTILTTYNSAMKCVELFHANNDEIDIAVYDEAHKTSGKFLSLFSMTLNSELPIKKRLFVTATPRHAGLDTKSDKEFFTMDDSDQYGEVCSSYLLRDAIEQNTVTDYKMLVASISDAELLKETGKNKNNSLTVMALALRKAMDEFSLKKVITYHPTIQEAKDFAYHLTTVINNFPVLHISSEQSKDDRNKAFDIYSREDGAIITNARCLGEGIDVPNTDAVMFCAPKTSTVDIVQSVGRAIRKFPGKECGYVILPSMYDNQEAEGGLGEYSTLVKVIGAMAENDSALAHVLKLRFENPYELEDKLSDFMVFTKGGGIDVEKVKSSISLRIIKSMHATFFERLEELKKHIEENGSLNIDRHEKKSLYLWTMHIRAMYAKGRLSDQKIKALNKIGFVWNMYEYVFEQRVQRLKAFIENGGDIKKASQDKEFIHFLKYVRTQFREGKLSDERESVLKGLGVVFDYNDLRTQKKLDELKYRKDNGLSIRDLSDWIKHLRKKYKEGTLEDKLMRKVESMGVQIRTDLSDQREKIFDGNLNELAAITAKGERLPHKVAIFRKNQRTVYNNGKLPKHREKKIREIEEKMKVSLIDWVDD